MPKTIRLFEQNPRVERFTQPKELKRLEIVIQDTKKVITHVTGLEPMLFMFIWNNMKQNQFALVFDHETKKCMVTFQKTKRNITSLYGNGKSNI